MMVIPTEEAMMRIQIIFEPEPEEEDETSDSGLTEEAYMEYSRHFGTIETIQRLGEWD